MALKLGKGSAFVKSRLRRLPQDDDVWEADFLRDTDYWMGIVIEQEHGFVYAMNVVALLYRQDHVLAPPSFAVSSRCGWSDRFVRLKSPKWHSTATNQKTRQQRQSKEKLIRMKAQRYAAHL